jgi:hypothetical protein
MSDGLTDYGKLLQYFYTMTKEELFFYLNGNNEKFRGKYRLTKQRLVHLAIDTTNNKFDLNGKIIPKEVNSSID